MVPRRIVLHHSATADGSTVSWNAIRRYHVQVRGWKDIGYHFGIEAVADPGGGPESYEILMGRLPDRVGAHCLHRNADSLGVCCVGDFDAWPPPPAQWTKAVELTAWLCRRWNISTAFVHGHREFARKTCPGRLFDLERFRRDVAALLTGGR
jgi:hypothetical protein